MTTVIKSVDETVTGFGLEFAASGDALVVLQGVTLQSTSSYVLHGTTDKVDVSATILGTLVSSSANAMNMEGARTRVVIGQSGVVSANSTDGSATAVYLAGVDQVFSNFGTVISATGRGLQMSGDRASGYNAGTISGALWGVVCGGASASFRNDGTILRSGGVGGDAAVRMSGPTDVWFENAGKVTSLGDGMNFGFRAISLTAHVVNSGEISSATDVGLYCTGATTLINSGLISGGSQSVELSGSADTVTNSGVMSGNVNLAGGADLFDGRGGSVVGVVLGGEGDDIFRIDTTTTRVSELSGQGTDRVEAWISLVLEDHIENLTLKGAAQRGSGNGLANILTGNAEDNLLVGLAGSDTLAGGLGDDWLYGGADADSLSGNDGRDTGFGQTGNDTLRGEGENDTLAGGVGADSLLGGDDDDRLSGGADNDRLYGEEGTDALAGGLGNDLLSGGVDEDRLHGGLGRDELYGGSDADTFIYTALAQSSGNTALSDVVRDFQRGLDTLDLSGLDANTGLAGNQAFAWRGTAAFSGAAGELRFAVSGTSLVVYATVNADKVADFAVVLATTAAIGSGDFLL